MSMPPGYGQPNPLMQMGGPPPQQYMGQPQVGYPMMKPPPYAIDDPYTKPPLYGMQGPMQQADFYQNLPSVPPTSGVASLLHHSGPGNVYPGERRRLGLSAPDNYGGQKEKHFQNYHQRDQQSQNRNQESPINVPGKLDMFSQMPQQMPQQQQYYQPPPPMQPQYYEQPQQYMPPQQMSMSPPPMTPMMYQQPQYMPPQYQQPPPQANPYQDYGAPRSHSMRQMYPPPPSQGGGVPPMYNPAAMTMPQYQPPPMMQQPPPPRYGSEAARHGLPTEPRETFFDKFGQEDEKRLQNTIHQDKARRLRDELQQQIDEKNRRKEEEKKEKERWEMKYGESMAENKNQQHTQQQVYYPPPQQQQQHNPYDPYNGQQQQHQSNNQFLNNSFSANPPQQQQQQPVVAAQQPPAPFIQTTGIGALPGQRLGSPSRVVIPVDEYKSELMHQIEEKNKKKEEEKKKKLAEEERDEMRVKKEMDELQKKYQAEINPGAAPPLENNDIKSVESKKNDRQPSMDHHQNINRRDSFNEQQQQQPRHNNNNNNGYRDNNNHYDDYEHQESPEFQHNRNRSQDDNRDYDHRNNSNNGSSYQDDRHNHHHNNNQRFSKQPSRRIEVNHGPIDFNQYPSVGPDSYPQMYENNFPPMQDFQFQNADFEPFKRQLQSQLQNFQKDIMRIQHQQKAMLRNYNKEIEQLQNKKQSIITDMKVEQDVQMKNQIHHLQSAIEQLTRKINKDQGRSSTPEQHRHELVAEVMHEIQHVLPPQIQFNPHHYSHSQSPPPPTQIPRIHGSQMPIQQQHPYQGHPQQHLRIEQHPHVEQHHIQHRNPPIEIQLHPPHTSDSSLSGTEHMSDLPKSITNSKDGHPIQQQKYPSFLPQPPTASSESFQNKQHPTTPIAAGNIHNELPSTTIMMPHESPELELHFLENLDHHEQTPHHAFLGSSLELIQEDQEDDDVVTANNNALRSSIVKPKDPSPPQVRNKSPPVSNIQRRLSIAERLPGSVKTSQQSKQQNDQQSPQKELDASPKPIPQLQHKLSITNMMKTSFAEEASKPVSSPVNESPKSNTNNIPGPIKLRNQAVKKEAQKPPAAASSISNRRRSEIITSQIGKSIFSKAASDKNLLKLSKDKETPPKPPLAAQVEQKNRGSKVVSPTKEVNNVRPSTSQQVVGGGRPGSSQQAVGGRFRGPQKIQEEKRVSPPKMEQKQQPVASFASVKLSNNSFQLPQDEIIMEETEPENDHDVLIEDAMDLLTTKISKSAISEALQQNAIRINTLELQQLKKQDEQKVLRQISNAMDSGQRRHEHLLSYWEHNNQRVIIEQSVNLTQVAISDALDSIRRLDERITAKKQSEIIQRNSSVPAVQNAILIDDNNRQATINERYQRPTESQVNEEYENDEQDYYSAPDQNTPQRFDPQQRKEMFDSFKQQQSQPSQNPSGYTADQNYQTETQYEYQTEVQIEEPLRKPTLQQKQQERASNEFTKPIESQYSGNVRQYEDNNLKNDVYFGMEQSQAIMPAQLPHNGYQVLIQSMEQNKNNQFIPPIGSSHPNYNEEYAHYAKETTDNNDQSMNEVPGNTTSGPEQYANVNQSVDPDVSTDNFQYQNQQRALTPAQMRINIAPPPEDKPIENEPAQEIVAVLSDHSMNMYANQNNEIMFGYQEELSQQQIIPLHMSMDRNIEQIQSYNYIIKKQPHHMIQPEQQQEADLYQKPPIMQQAPWRYQGNQIQPPQEDNRDLLDQQLEEAKQRMLRYNTNTQETSQADAKYQYLLSADPNRQSVNNEQLEQIQHDFHQQQLYQELQLYERQVVQDMKEQISSSPQQMRGDTENDQSTFPDPTNFLYHKYLIDNKGRETYFNPQVQDDLSPKTRFFMQANMAPQYNLESKDSEEFPQMNQQLVRPAPQLIPSSALQPIMNGGVTIQQRIQQQSQVLQNQSEADNAAQLRMRNQYEDPETTEDEKQALQHKMADINRIASQYEQVSKEVEDSRMHDEEKNHIDMNEYYMHNLMKVEQMFVDRSEDRWNQKVHQQNVINLGQATSDNEGPLPNGPPPQFPLVEDSQDDYSKQKNSIKASNPSKHLQSNNRTQTQLEEMKYQQQNKKQKPSISVERVQTRNEQSYKKPPQLVEFDSDKKKTLQRNLNKQYEQQSSDGGILNIADPLSSMDENYTSKSSRRATNSEMNSPRNQSRNQMAQQIQNLPDINIGQSQKSSQNGLNQYPKNKQQKPPLPPIGNKGASRNLDNGYNSYSMPQQQQNMMLQQQYPQQQMSQQYNTVQQLPYPYQQMYVMQQYPPNIQLPPIRQQQNMNNYDSESQTSVINIFNNDDSLQSDTNTLNTVMRQQQQPIMMMIPYQQLPMQTNLISSQNSYSELFERQPSSKQDANKKIDPFSIRTQLREKLYETSQLLRVDNMNLLQKVQELGRSVKPNFYSQGLPPIIDLADREPTPKNIQLHDQVYVQQNTEQMQEGVEFTKNLKQWEESRSKNRKSGDERQISRADSQQQSYTNNDFIKDMMNSRMQVAASLETLQFSNRGVLPPISIGGATKASPAAQSKTSGKQLLDFLREDNTANNVLMTERTKSERSHIRDELRPPIKPASSSLGRPTTHQTSQRPTTQQQPLRSIQDSPANGPSNESPKNRLSVRTGLDDNISEESKGDGRSAPKFEYRIVENTVETPRNVFLLPQIHSSSLQNSQEGLFGNTTPIEETKQSYAFQMQPINIPIDSQSNASMNIANSGQNSTQQSAALQGLHTNNQEERTPAGNQEESMIADRGALPLFLSGHAVPMVGQSQRNNQEEEVGNNSFR